MDTMWIIKIAIKLILGRLPFKHQLLRSLNLFRHGKMDDPAYALKIFRLHFKQAPESLVVLELGPGDSLASALIAKAHGAKKVYLVDVGSYAKQSVKSYQIMARQLEQAGLKHLPDMENITTIDGMLEQCNAEYLTNGLQGLNKIPSASVDFIWSHSVVEHIRKRDFEKTFRELHRILKDDGQASHNVNLQDHLQHSLNSLRFAESLWESDFFAHSGFYTNRLRCTESLKIMEKAGFRVADLNRGFWESLPLPKTLLHPDFQHFSDEELRTRTYSVLLAKR